MISPQRRLLLIGSATGAVVIGMATLAGAAVIDPPRHFNIVEATSTTVLASAASTPTSTFEPVEVEASAHQPTTTADQPTAVVAVTLANSAPPLAAPQAAATSTAPSIDDDDQGDEIQGDDDQADEDQTGGEDQAGDDDGDHGHQDDEGEVESDD